MNGPRAAARSAGPASVRRGPSQPALRSGPRFRIARGPGESSLLTPLSPMKLSRRRFLRQSAVAFGAPLFIPGSVLGLNGAVAPSNRITPSNTAKLSASGDVAAATSASQPALSDPLARRARAKTARIVAHHSSVQKTRAPCSEMPNASCSSASTSGKAKG